MFIGISIYDKIQDVLKEAMKNGDHTKRDVLRCAVSEIKNKTVNAGKEINDDVCITVLQKMAKQHEESISQFNSANRTDLVSREALELSYIKFYLPNMLNEVETKHYLEMYINDNKIELIKKNMGLIMKHVKTMREIDGKIASKILNEMLKC